MFPCLSCLPVFPRPLSLPSLPFSSSLHKRSFLEKMRECQGPGVLVQSLVLANLFDRDNKEGTIAHTDCSEWAWVV
jgi:hypothetical protein